MGGTTESHGSFVPDEAAVFVCPIQTNLVERVEELRGVRMATTETAEERLLADLLARASAELEAVT
ncbi:MAG: hypothetical protein ACXVA4_14515, partial [Ktedonobacterales bacterium]